MRTPAWLNWPEQATRHIQWANTYGVARSALALGALLSLLFNDIRLLIAPMGRIERQNPDFTWQDIGIFNLLPDHLEWAKWIFIGILVLVISGWRPRITGLLHWWVSFSFATGGVLIDGGDQITQVLTFFLIPVTLADGRRWHWQDTRIENPAISQRIGILIAWSAFFMIRLQVAFIYFHAGIGKLAVEEWTNGTAMYYWFTNPNFGLVEGLKPLLMPLMTDPIGVTISTWSVLLLEILLFLGIALPAKYHPFLLRLGLMFHFGIVVVHGLVSFFFAMAGALILFLGPKKGFRFSYKKQGLGDQALALP